MEKETYEHYATGELKELEIVESHENHKIGFSEKENKYYKIIKDSEKRWQISKTSFFMQHGNQRN